MSTAAQVTNEYRNLPIAVLQESPTNPRRRFDETALNELAASIKAKGILQPILVRALDAKKFEVVLGARRFRASKLAALEEVPVRIKQMTDAECVEAQLVENIQREGVHPLEEAFAFHALLHTDGLQYDVQSLAAKSGKSPAFVATRLRLVELIPSIAEAFLADKIGVGHALEIAKLPQGEQQRAFDAAFRSMYSGGKEGRILLPVRELTTWIEQNILLTLDSAPFDKDDESLLPEAGSCAHCPKRTGFNTLLFGDVFKDSCTDGVCYNAKLTRHIERQVTEKPKLVQISTEFGKPAEGQVLGRGRYVALNLAGKNGKQKQPLSAQQKPCKSMGEAIVFEGSERGRTVKVCADPSCAVHFADKQGPSPEQIAKEREKRRKELERSKAEAMFRHRVLAEIIKRVGAPLGRGDLDLVAAALLNRTEPLKRELLARRHKLLEGSSRDITHQQTQQAIAKLLKLSDEAALCKLLVEVVLLDRVDAMGNGHTDVLMSVAKRHRVDTDAIREAVTQEGAAKRAKQNDKEAAKKNKSKSAA